MSEFLPQNGLLNPISKALCKHTLFTSRLCVDFIFFIVGKSTQLDKVCKDFYLCWRRRRFSTLLDVIPSQFDPTVALTTLY